MILGALLAAALAYAVYRLFLGYSRPGAEYSHLASREVAFIEAAAEAMFPAGGAMPLSGRDAHLARYVDRYFEVLQGPKKLQVRLLLMLVEQATFFFPAPGRFGMRRFSALSSEQREEALRQWSESSLYPRRLVFAALRAVLTMGYLGHPVAMRHLRLAPYDFDSPILEPDVLYPPIGACPDEIRWSRADLTEQSDGTPIDLDGPLHRDYADRPL